MKNLQMIKSIIIMAIMLVMAINLNAAKPGDGGLGDPNENGIADIVDALMTAQYYVGLKPDGFNPAYGDVTKGDGKIDIVDALLIAQLYIGQITRLPRDILDPLHVEEMQIVDQSGQRVSLNGLVVSNNCWGVWTWPESMALEEQGLDPMIRPLKQAEWAFTTDDVQRLGSIGVRAVRYQINHELFAFDNPEQANNMKILKRFIEALRDQGIYTILNMHLPAGRDIATDNNSKWFPGDQRMQSIYEDDFYWNQHLEVWRYLARELKNYGSVAGFEPDNEPRLPSLADGGMEKYQAKWNELCGEIRIIDPDHIIFVPECNSREANPGEMYWNPNEEKMMEDQGEQGTIWERVPVTVDSERFKNIVYVFHFYEPWDFTGGGEALNESEMEKMMIQSKEIIDGKLNWSKNIAKAPMICTEYGVNRSQTMDNRIRYMSFINEEFEKQGVSSLYYCYKSGFGVYVNLPHIFAIYSEYNTINDELIIDDNSYDYKSSTASEAAVKNGFAEIFEKYFWNNGQVQLFSIIENEPLLAFLQQYWKDPE